MINWLSMWRRAAPPPPLRAILVGAVLIHVVHEPSASPPFGGGGESRSQYMVRLTDRFIFLPMSLVVLELVWRVERVRTRSVDRTFSSVAAWAS